MSKEVLEEELKEKKSEFYEKELYFKIDKKKEELEEESAIITSLNEKIPQIDEEIQNQEDTLKKLKDEKKNIESNTNKAIESLEKILKACSIIQKKIENIQQVLKIYDNEIEDLKSKKEETRSKIEDYSKLIQEHNISIESTRNIKEIEKEINVLEKKINAAKDSLGNNTVEDIIVQYHNTLNFYHSLEKIHKKAEEQIEQAKISVNTRHEKMHEIQYSFQQMFGNMFSSFLSLKGYQGSAFFDNKEKTLNLRVLLNIGSSHSNIQNLSGGEKAYATIAMLMALWKLIESPFRALDEPDVFMDTMVRRITLNSITEEATEYHKFRQVILITPHSISEIPNKNNVHIIRLKPAAVRIVENL